MNYDRFLTRVWDKKEKKMLYLGDLIVLSDFDCIGCNRNGILLSINYRLIVHAYLKEGEDDTTAHLPRIVYYEFGDRFIPMQCTGLKDKNDKLIYEGDLITIDEDFTKITDVELKYCPVGYEDGGFMYCRSKLRLELNEFDTYLWMVTREKNYCEIAGNCWQNPELLEQNK
jgi:uncharacterized phage protein (TIGR01671 family)